MKNNKIEIIGDNNQVFQDIKKSSIDNSKKSYLPSDSKWTIISVVAAIVSLVVTIIIGWDDILKFFGYAG